MSDGEQALAWQITVEHLPQPERQYKFCKWRKWAADFAWPEKRILVEVEGAVYANGRHTRGAGFEKDCEKYNTATLLGWKVYRVTTGMVERGEALELLKKAILGE